MWGRKSPFRGKEAKKKRGGKEGNGRKVLGHKVFRKAKARNEGDEALGHKEFGGEGLMAERAGGKIFREVSNYCGFFVLY